MIVILVGAKLRIEGVTHVIAFSLAPVNKQAYYMPMHNGIKHKTCYVSSLRPFF